MDKSSSGRTVPLYIQVELVDSAADKKPDLYAYVFSSQAQLLATAPVDAKGAGVINVPATDTVARLRVVIGPKLDGNAPTVSELTRRGAQEVHLRQDTKTQRLEAQLSIYSNIWKTWWRNRCLVRGNLNKRVLVGGQYVDYPVCNAEVEVYEVDPLFIIIPNLPDLIIDRLRDIIIDPRPLPLPIPEPGPDPTPFARAAMLQPHTATDHRLTADSASMLRALSSAGNLRYSAQVGSKLQFQQALIDNAALIRPLLCWLYPRFVTKQLIATTHTDECGHFQTTFYKSFLNPDQPDLYFKAKQKLFGFLDVYIYAPTPVACYTWWNYVCGTTVNLYTSSPWAHTCSPCPPVIGPPGKNRWVAFMSIGAHGLNNIYGTAQDLAGATNATNIGLTQSGAPWGGMLLPRLEFSNDLEAAGVRYYQLSWRKGNSGSFLPLTGQVHHYYRHDVLTPAGNLPTWSPELLGPFNVNDGMGHVVPNLFKIPFASVAPAGVWDTPPDINEIKEHFASAKFPTQDSAPGMSYDGNGNLLGTDTSGKYQLKVDLFNGNGQPINISTTGIVYAVPTDPDSTGAISTVDAGTLGLVSGNSMIITLHVDNNRCFADISAPTIGAVGADPCCGVLQYHDSDSVSLSLRAQHPHGFARYSFSIVRGTATVVSIPSTPVSSATITDVETVDYLLNTNLPVGCAIDGCPVAGFSENLYVDSLATDGWGSELGYDASAVRAFVLAKS